MKKQGLVNHFVSEILAGMGHTDRLVVTDMGFPIPQEAKKVDLTVRRNLPTFFDVLEAILEEFQVEKGNPCRGNARCQPRGSRASRASA